MPAARRVQFDLFGFTALSLAIGALQLLLDRGQQNDWFSSNETWVEAIVLLVAFAYFVAHTALTPADESFLDYRMLKNANFVSGLTFIFIVGLVLYATRALLPTMLEDLLNLLFAGFSITALALWQMTGYSFDLSQGDILWPGVVQGIGTGLIFVPLSASAFATLSPDMRGQGTALFSLVRNIGSSIGISMVQVVLVRSTVNAHAGLVERLTAKNPAWSNPAVSSIFDISRPGGAAALDALVTQQAAMIAYLNDFRLMLYLTLAVIPLLLFLRSSRQPAGAQAHAAID